MNHPFSDYIKDQKIKYRDISEEIGFTKVYLSQVLTGRYPMKEKMCNQLFKYLFDHSLEPLRLFLKCSREVDLPEHLKKEFDRLANEISLYVRSPTIRKTARKTKQRPLVRPPAKKNAVAKSIGKRKSTGTKGIKAQQLSMLD